MEIINVTKKENYNESKALKRAYASFKKMLEELKKKDIPEKYIETINQYVLEINKFEGSFRKLYNKISVNQHRILQLIEKELKLVPKYCHKNRWMTIGMAAFGLPIGGVLAFVSGQLAFIGIGLPVGLVLGMSFGSNMDKKAKAENRQIDIEIEY